MFVCLELNWRFVDIFSWQVHAKKRLFWTDRLDNIYTHVSFSLFSSLSLSLSLTHTHTNALRHTLNPHPETHIPSCLHFYLYLDVFLLLNPNLFIISLSVICFLHLVRFSVFMFWCPLFPAFGKYRFNKSFRIAKDSLTLKENFCKQKF